MALPAVLFSNGCCGRLNGARSGDIARGVLDFTAKILFGVALTDLFTMLTCLVIGILGATSLISMPLPAAYILIGTGGALILSWVVGAVISRGKSLAIVSELFNGASHKRCCFPT
jgi:hypothetical protein